MRIIINALATRGGGAETYLKGILPALSAVDPKSEFFVLRSPWQQFWDFYLPDNIHLVDSPLSQERSVWKRIIWEQVYIPRIAREENCDIIFCPTDIASLFSPGKTVLAIRNLNVYIGSDLQRGWSYYINRKILLRTMTWISAKKASRIIFSSNFIRTIVCQQLGIPISKTEVIPQGLKSSFFKHQNNVPEWIEKLPRPYLLSVSAIKAHKNYPFLIKAFIEVIHRLNLPHHIVIAGHQEFQPHISEMRQIMEQPGMGERLHLLGPVPHSDLPALYQRADLFVLPSLIESFGHPLVEAMASGIPIVASNVTALPEIGKDAAVYFNPEDINDAINKISQVITDHSLRELLVNKGYSRAAEFSWEKTAEKTMALFQNA